MNCLEMLLQTIVSSELPAKSRILQCRTPDVLTGFKFIGENGELMTGKRNSLALKKVISSGTHARIRMLLWQQCSWLKFTPGINPLMNLIRG